MIARAAYLAIALAMALPGTATAQDCDRAEASLAEMFDRLHAENGGFSGEQFASLSEAEKWYWTSNLLDAQVRRLDAMMKVPADVPREKMRTAIEVFHALDAAEPCYEGPDMASDAPGMTARERLRAEIEVLQ